jgi:membrane associated rhomboid family serine protease
MAYFTSIVYIAFSGIIMFVAIERGNALYSWTSLICFLSGTLCLLLKNHAKNRPRGKYYVIGSLIRRKTWSSPYFVISVWIICIFNFYRITYPELFTLKLAETGYWPFYRLITYAFFHVDIFHLFGNLIIFFLLFQYAKVLIGGTRCFAVCVIAIATCGVFCILANELPARGLSGANYGIMGLLIVIAIKDIFSWNILPVDSLNDIIIFFIMMIIGITPFYRDMAFLGHLGGFLTGIFIGVFLRIEIVENSLKIFDLNPSKDFKH